jgi:hypothetical protein
LVTNKELFGALEPKCVMVRGLCALCGEWTTPGMMLHHDA